MNSNDLSIGHEESVSNAMGDNNSKRSEEEGFSAPNIPLDDRISSRSDIDREANRTELDENHLTEQKILDIAEEVFLKVSDRIREKYSLSSLYSHKLEIWELEGEQVKAISPENFLSSFEEIGIYDLDEIEKDWLLKVLEKPEIDNKILFNDLVMILENFGVSES